MTLITGRPSRSRAHRDLADEQRPQLAVELARLLRRAPVAAVADDEPGGLGAEPLLLQPLDEPVYDLVRLGAVLPRHRLGALPEGSRGRRPRRRGGRLRRGGPVDRRPEPRVLTGPDRSAGAVDRLLQLLDEHVAGLRVVRRPAGRAASRHAELGGAE